MRLVQRTFGNRISSMARVQSAQVEQSVWQFSSGEPNQTEASIWDGLIPMQHEQATISCMLRNAPRELADLFKLMVSELHEPYRRVKLGRWTLRETSDDYYARQLGMPEGTNISAMLEDYFSPA